MNKTEVSLYYQACMWYTADVVCFFVSSHFIPSPDFPSHDGPRKRFFIVKLIHSCLQIKHKMTCIQPFGPQSLPDVKLRVVPQFSSRIVEQAKRERA